MMSLALLMIPELLKKIKLTKESVLDIGGSHGLYSIALCRSNPDIAVTIIDSEYAMPLLKKNIKEAGMEHRIKLITGDFMESSFQTKFDRILLFNVLHEHKEAYNIELLSKIRGTLNRKGSLIILDGMREKKISRLADLAARMYSLMFFHFLGGQNYSFKEISMWLKSSGFPLVKRKELYKSGFSMIIGE
jgi:cyclopropane fatty-acyl-phospholipid synthase-like methyltransferase